MVAESCEGECGWVCEQNWASPQFVSRLFCSLLLSSTLNSVRLLVTGPVPGLLCRRFRLRPFVDLSIITLFTGFGQLTIFLTLQ